MLWICRHLCAARRIAKPPGSTGARSGGSPGSSSFSMRPHSIIERPSCFNPGVSMPCGAQWLACSTLSMPRIVPEEPMHASQPRCL